MKDRERRNVAAAVEARADAAGAPKLAGYAARFGAETVIAGLFREVILAGAFGEALGKSDVRALFNHDANQIPLGRTSSGTLTLEEDAQGLAYEIVLPETTLARDLYASVKRGDVAESSFAFTIDTEEWVYPKDELPLRRIVKFEELFDISPVVYPAYDVTSVSARTLEAVGAKLRAQSLVRGQAEQVLAAARLRWAKAKSHGT